MWNKFDNVVTGKFLFWSNLASNIREIQVELSSNCTRGSSYRKFAHIDRNATNKLFMTPGGLESAVQLAGPNAG